MGQALTTSDIAFVTFIRRVLGGQHDAKTAAMAAKVPLTDGDGLAAIAAVNAAALADWPAAERFARAWFGGDEAGEQAADDYLRGLHS